MKREIISVGKCLDWINRQMIAGEAGSRGIYERFMTDTQTRSRCVRPDCNAEAARVLWKFKLAGGGDSQEPLYDNIVKWLLEVQRKDEKDPLYGTFPFYLEDGHRMDESLSSYLYQNDNGKVLVALADLYALTGDERMKEAVCTAADFWCGLQTPEGLFYHDEIPELQAAYRGPAFSLWLALGLLMCGTYFQVPRYIEAAKRSFCRLDALILNTGRMQTTYELEGGEAWRPASSESAIALYCYTRAFEITKEQKYFEKADRLAGFIKTLQSPQGGIVNCNGTCLEASQQNREDLCDLVYTQGYALLGLAHFAGVKSDYIDCAYRLAQFLMEIQCEGESPLWDGAWRGAYSISGECWSGRADQGGNLLDEGGMYAIYTGWCCMPIAEGLLETMKFSEKERE